MLVLIPNEPPMSGGTMKRSLFSASPSTRAVSGVHDERPHEVGPDGADAVELPSRDDAVRLDGGGAVLREAEALAQHDLGLAEGAVRIAVDEPAVTGEIRAGLLVEHGGVGLERLLGIDHGRRGAGRDPPP